MLVPKNKTIRFIMSRFKFYFSFNFICNLLFGLIHIKQLRTIMGANGSTSFNPSGHPLTPI
jgi:hypothetical protein